ncbi:MAG: hypothetical protein WAM90_15715, partial [Rhodanobacter sp.]
TTRGTGIGTRVSGIGVGITRRRRSTMLFGEMCRWPLKTIKPRIWRFRGMWVCASGFYVGSGPTIMKAYADWIASVTFGDRNH